MKTLKECCQKIIPSSASDAGHSEKDIREKLVKTGAVDDGIDYEERLHEIHIELISLNEEAVALANVISENYNDLFL